MGERGKNGCCICGMLKRRQTEKLRIVLLIYWICSQHLAGYFCTRHLVLSAVLADEAAWAPHPPNAEFYDMLSKIRFVFLLLSFLLSVVLSVVSANTRTLS